MVSTAPTRPKNPPTSVEEYLLSYDIPAHRMKFRLGDDIWIMDEFAGQWEMLGVTPENRLRVRCQLAVEPSGQGNLKGYIWMPEDTDLDFYESFMTDDSLNTCHRLCANKVDSAATGEPHWRLRDERTGYMVTNECKDYRGAESAHYAPWYNRMEHQPVNTCNCGACDSFRHVYMTGRSTYDPQTKVAYFAP